MASRVWERAPHKADNRRDRPVQVGRARRRVLVASAAGFLGFYLELSVVPYIAARHGGRFAAGILTFALMAATVAMQALIPLLLRRFSPRALYGTGLLLIGPPTFLYGTAGSVTAFALVTLIRGAGFGLITVMGAAMIGAYSVPGARGNAFGTFGVVTSGWAAFAPALGVAVAHSSASTIFAIGALAPLLGVMALIATLPPAAVRPTVWRRTSSSAGDALGPPTVIFTATAAAIAAAFTFLPLLSIGSPTLLLILFGTTFTAGRLLGGRFTDRVASPTVFVLWLIGGTLIGLTLLGTSHGIVVTTGAAISGLTIGGLCTATLVIMFDRAGRDGTTRASVFWNMAFDIGQALGGVGFGAVAAATRPGGVFFAAGIVIAAVAAPTAAFDWHRTRG